MVLNHLIYRLLILLLLSPIVVANDSKQWLIEEIKVDDGLPSSTVFSLQQDQLGFMWFGTTNGLARYDGYSFKIFKHDGSDVNTISNNNAGNIFIDSQNIMWIGTFGGGFNSLDLNTGELIRYPYSSSKIDEMVSENVQTFYQDINSNIWIGTATGLYQFKDGDLTHYNHDENDSNSLVNSRVWSITGDQNGGIWIGTSEGLSHLNPTTGIFRNYKLPEALKIDISSNQFRKLLITKDNLWIGTSTGLYNFDFYAKHFNSFNSEQQIKINDLKFINTNQLLIASMEGLFQFNLDTNSFKFNQDGSVWQAFENVDVRSILFSKSGLLWLATRDNGVIKVDQIGGMFNHHINYISESQINEKNKQVWSLGFDSESNLFIGTYDTLYKKYANGSVDKIVSDKSNAIPGIVRTNKISFNNGLWIGTSEGLYFLDSKSTIAKTITEPFELVGIKPTDIFSIEESPNGEIWLALYNIGVLHWNPSNATAELIQSYKGVPLTDLNIVDIYQDSNDNIWIGTNLVGVIKYNLKKDEMTLFKHDYNDSNSLSSNRIKDMFEDSRGKMWIATSTGINLFNAKDNTFTHFYHEYELPNNSITAVLEDSNQILWIANRFGVSEFNPETGKFNNYLLNKAFRNNGLIPRSAAIDSNDRLYMGSSNGYFTFNPNDLNNKASFQSSLLITNININNKPLSFKDLALSPSEFELNSNDRIIAFDIAALDYKISKQIKYFYKIEGLHDDWIDVSTSRHVELYNLIPGQYVLEIKASNNDGRWHEQFLNLKLDIIPVWWKRGWVQALFALVGMLIVLSIHYYRTYKIKKQNLLLESEVKSRTSELISLNEQLKLASQTDFLTGLYNRSGFFNYYNEKESQLSNCSIVIADIDNFKKINDIYGHNAGDEVLKKVSHIMRSLIPKDDLIARWGGEEFIFYLRNKNANEAFQMIEIIRLELQNAEITYNDQQIPVTCTFGICQKDLDMSLDDCINTADESMYQGKKNGRNNTVISNVA